jgi:hypothetical protein
MLLANRVTPILMIAFTNHALDHILCSVLDAKITQRMVRLGNRKADERLANYSLEHLEVVAGRSRGDRSFGQQHRALKLAEEGLKELTREVFTTCASSPQIVQHLEINYAEAFHHLNSPPKWIGIMREQDRDDENKSGWRKAGAGGRSEELNNSVYMCWREGRDLDFLQRMCQVTPPRAPSPEPFAANRFAALIGAHHHDIGETSSTDYYSEASSEDEDDDSTGEPTEERWKNLETWGADVDPVQLVAPLHTNMDASPPSPTQDSPADSEAPPLRRDEEFFLYECGYDEVPTVPQSYRSLDELLEAGDVWRMSYAERNDLHNHWQAEAQEAISTAHLQNYERLRKRHADALRNYHESKDEVGALSQCC